MRSNMGAPIREGAAIPQSQPLQIGEMLRSTNLDLDRDTVSETTKWGNALLRSRLAWANRARNGKRYFDRDDDYQPPRNQGGRYVR